MRSVESAGLLPQRLQVVNDAEMHSDPPEKSILKEKPVRGKRVSVMWVSLMLRRVRVEIAAEMDVSIAS